jgi:hypothetical protein
MGYRIGQPKGRVPRTTLETGRGDRLQRRNVETALFGLFDQNTFDGHLLSFMARGVEYTCAQQLVLLIAQRFRSCNP